MEATSAFPLTSLPFEVLAVVLSHLEVQERLNACLVCKDWLELINCKLLLRDINVHIRSIDDMDLFTSMTRNFLNFTFQAVLFDHRFIQLSKCFAPYIERIVIIDCSMNESRPITLADVSFENLKELTFKDCDFLRIFPALPNLLKLELPGENNTTDDKLSILQRSMKHLKTLTLDRNVVYNPRFYEQFYPRGLTYEANPSQEILSFLALKSFISERVSTLSELDLDSISGSALKQLSCIPYLNLKKISINKIYEFENGYKCEDGLINLFKTQQNLKNLNLEYINLDDDTITALITFLPNIEVLKLKFCTVTNQSLKNMCSLNQLKTLLILHIKGTNRRGRNEAIFSINSKQMKHLEISGLGDIPDFSLQFKQLTHLTYLEIKRCSVTDSCLHNISTYLVKLEFLDISENDISDCGITGFLATDKNQGPPSSYQTVANRALYNLKFLRVLYLSYCKVTENGLIATIMFPYLHSLKILGYNISKNAASILCCQNPQLDNFSYHYLTI